MIKEKPILVCRHEQTPEMIHCEETQIVRTPMECFKQVRIGSDDQEELTVCGAYMNRMVLGGKRLHEVCETLNHLHCEYFINSGIGI